MRVWLSIFVYVSLCVLPAVGGEFDDANFDPEQLPAVPAEFEVSMWAREPLVRQPCSMAFDAQGRLFVGMGPQYRNPTPETPGDDVVIISDHDGDGVAESSKSFATGFNAIQGLAWYGRDLWIANAPDLTVVRDTDDNDEADEYVKVYSNLGNLEHGLHGLNFAPDGWLYMSKGNSKGKMQSDIAAPKAFRELWGMRAPEGTPDFPPPQSFARAMYRHAYHDPADDWGLHGGVLRCRADGGHLEIVARGCRNPWDMAFDSGFHWLATDNDQTQGDRVFSPFFHAHFGWNHRWSSHWTDAPHAPTAPVCGPLFEGSGTGVTYCDAATFPAAYRDVFFVNDWLRKVTYLWRPEWHGATMRPSGRTWSTFIDGGRSLYRPTDLEIGPDGALWVLGWSSGYGAEWKDGQLNNQGRIYRIAAKRTANPIAISTATRATAPIADRTVEELVEDLNGPLPIWRLDAQNELVRRGPAVIESLRHALDHGALRPAQETWILWALGRIATKCDDANLRADLTSRLSTDHRYGINQREQVTRIVAEWEVAKPLEQREVPSVLIDLLHDKEPRIRFAAVQGFGQIQRLSREAFAELASMMARESDPQTFYAGWQTLRVCETSAALLALLEDPRGGVRRAALLALLESETLDAAIVQPFTHDDDSATRQIALDWLAKMSAGREIAAIRGPALHDEGALADRVSPDESRLAVAAAVETRDQRQLPVMAGGCQLGARVYLDRDYRIVDCSPELLGADLIQVANDEDGVTTARHIRGDLRLPVRIWIGVDRRLAQIPRWIRDSYAISDLQLRTNDTEFQWYSRSAPPGQFELGPNIEEYVATPKSHYVVALTPVPLTGHAQPVTFEMVEAKLAEADVARGELLFHHPHGAGCVRCHRVDVQRNGFGPNLADIGRRATQKHLVTSIVDPSDVITEGFRTQVIATHDGRTFQGVLLEESGIAISIGLANGETISIPREMIAEQTTIATSAMPSYRELLTDQQIADLVTYLQAMTGSVALSTGQPATSKEVATVADSITLERRDDRVVVRGAGQSQVEYVYRDGQILRPYFSNITTAQGERLSRRHPPEEGLDATDHPTMHPGFWLGLGDVNGEDFWRNRGSIEHDHFREQPLVRDGQVRFVAESRLKRANGAVMGSVVDRCVILARSDGWLIIWDATFTPAGESLVFGDQEEMGFGVRVASQLTEKQGGIITNARGLKTAALTWGQEAAWCDYSRIVEGRQQGVTLMVHPKSFRPAWWHNRDYGVFVANPFGRAAMKQGEVSRVEIEPGVQTLRLVAGALFYSRPDASVTQHFVDFLKAYDP